MAAERLDRSFFARPALAVARDLLGRDLVVQRQQWACRVRVFEAEAYAEEDRACHAFGGRRTPRTEPMFAAGGLMYVYFTYGMHHCFNVVTGPAGVGEAVLVRSAVPLAGLDAIAAARNLASLKRMPPASQWLDGPGRLAQGLGLTRADSGLPLDGSAGVWFEVGQPPQPSEIQMLPRVGVAYAGADADLPWRFACDPMRAQAGSP
ncbi:MAG: DNA-3-methyladenine glycosylase [Deltaproteobacteria bacterium]|nr:DNA-3-methyladenine glycosylase [Deltaproteobacteria bacterium]